jgi:hypothetical protein
MNDRMRECLVAATEELTGSDKESAEIKVLQLERTGVGFGRAFLLRALELATESSSDLVEENTEDAEW